MHRVWHSDRRRLLTWFGAVGGIAALGGCATPPPEGPAVSAAPEPVDEALWSEWRGIYADYPDEQFPVPAVNFEEVDTRVLRRFVPYQTPEPPGTLIVDTGERALLLVMEGGEALRYGVGVGREGLAWSGRAAVGRKAEWPRWTPTKAMIAREPEKNGPWAGGMPPGLDNPLGARALYLHRNGRDLMYRIHGTNDPSSIGTAVSSGCIRMINQDVIDLYERVPVGAPVIVK
jgi:lipoprotein-anchoring transpeptidase ErfK/SrfK